MRFLTVCEERMGIAERMIALNDPYREIADNLIECHRQHRGVTIHGVQQEPVSFKRDGAGSRVVVDLHEIRVQVLKRDGSR